jgi:hypothetical protein
MPIRFEERPGSGAMSEQPPALEKLYYCSGTADENQVMAIAMAATDRRVATPMGILFRQPIQLRWEGGDHCGVIVPYGPTNRDVGSIHVSFSTTGGTAHITQALSTVSSYGVAVPDMKGTIGVNGDDVDGCDIVTPALKLRIRCKHPQAVITLDQIRNLARSTAYVNSDVFLGFQAGELLFLGADGEQGTETETSVGYEFDAKENAVGAKALTIGDIANVEKQGHDYAWISYGDEEDADRPVKHAKHVYVVRVYRRTGFVQLFGFGN